MQTTVKRVYEPAAKSDGYRILADRLWPRGVSKQKAQIDFWAKDFAPSTALRQWLHAAPEQRYAEFTQRYRAELAGNRAALKAALPRRARATLVTAAKDIGHSHLPTLQKFLARL